jgi:hypothetical protein
MEKSKSNGQVGPAKPAVTAPELRALEGDPASTDPFDQVKTLITRMGNKRYVEGYRRAMTIISRSVGQLDGENKLRISKTLDQLENELHQAEVATK